jgi:DNA-binding LytR/AlgR family response regulator
MQKFRCLIVDDEKLAQDVIEKFIESMPMLEVSGKCKNAIEAIGYLYKKNVDIMFLDINMPEISGLEMLRTISNPPKVILTTAYSEFALEGYEFGVIDYLLKPVKFDRFVKAVNRAMELLYSNEHKVMDPDHYSGESISLFIKEDNITYAIEFSRIMFIQAYGNYLKIYSSDRTYVIRETLQNIVNKLPGKYFMRVHKSYIVSCQMIKKITGNVIYIDNHEIPIGNTFKSEVAARLFGQE